MGTEGSGLSHEFLTLGGRIGLAWGAAEELLGACAGRLPEPEVADFRRLAQELEAELRRAQANALRFRNGVPIDRAAAGALYAQHVRAWTSGVDQLAAAVASADGRVPHADPEAVRAIAAALQNAVALGRAF